MTDDEYEGGDAACREISDAKDRRIVELEQQLAELRKAAQTALVSYQVDGYINVDELQQALERR